MFKRSNFSAGFTLIELMITMVIIGIFASMAIPSFQKTWEKNQFRAGNKAFTSALRKARSYAISNKQPFGIYVDAEALTVTLFRDIVNPGNLAYDEGDSTYVVDTLPREFTYLYSYPTTNVIMFQPNGTAQFGGDIGTIITMAQSERLTGIYVVNVLASTGRVKSSSAYY